MRKLISRLGTIVAATVVVSWLAIPIIRDGLKHFNPFADRDNGSGKPAMEKDVPAQARLTPAAETDVSGEESQTAWPTGQPGALMNLDGDTAFVFNDAAATHVLSCRGTRAEYRVTTEATFQQSLAILERVSQGRFAMAYWVNPQNQSDPVIIVENTSTRGDLETYRCHGPNYSNVVSRLRL